jgi:hypothetical protein
VNTPTPSQCLKAGTCQSETGVCHCEIRDRQDPPFDRAYRFVYLAVVMLTVLWTLGLAWATHLQFFPTN